MTDTDIRTFLTSTTRWMDERYERVWNELGEQPASRRRRFGTIGLPLGCCRQPSCAMAFEAYLEKVGAEVLRRRGYRRKVQLGWTTV